MTLEKFHSAIMEAIELPIFYEVIDVEEPDDMPGKYLFYTTGETITLNADNVVWWSSTPVELVAIHGSAGIDDSIKEAVEGFLESMEIPYTGDDDYDNNLTSWVTTYSFNI